MIVNTSENKFSDVSNTLKMMLLCQLDFWHTLAYVLWDPTDTASIQQIERV